MEEQKRILFICGSMNQTTQMHQISRHLTGYRQAFTPFYCDGVQEAMRRLKLLEFTIIGAKLAERCEHYLRASDLAIDYQGQRGPYDLVVTCSDVFVQKNIRRRPDRTGAGRHHRSGGLRPSAWCSGTGRSPCGSRGPPRRA